MYLILEMSLEKTIEGIEFEIDSKARIEVTTSGDGKMGQPNGPSWPAHIIIVG